MATKIVTKNSSTASAVPTASDLVQGELAVNVADKRLFTEDNAGAIVELGTNPSGNVTFQDNGKAIFGAGSDLQIYHNATSNIIDSSAATLAIQAPQFVVQDAGGTKNMIWVPQGGSGYEVQLAHDGTTKLTTTSTGIDVTGTATMDGLTSSGDVTLGSGASLQIDDQDSLLFGTFAFGSSGTLLQGGTSVAFDTFVGGKKRHTIASNGDISFYEDTGTTAKLFWDASAESLGIGTSSPSEKLHMFKATYPIFKIESTSYSGTLGIDTGNGNLVLNNVSNAGLLFNTNNTERMRIDSSGQVKVGTTGPTWDSTFRSFVTKGGFLASQSTSYSYLGGQAYYDGAFKRLNANAAELYEQSFGNHIFYNAISGAADSTITWNERMRIDSSGNVIVSGAGSGSLGKLTTRSDGGTPLAVSNESASGTLVALMGNGSGNLGSITHSGSSVAYNTTSDYRLKEDDVPMTGATERVKALRPINFAWKVDGSRVDGFFAHEAQEVVPECATGSKDAMRDEEYEVTPAVEEVRDEDGNVTTEAVAAVMGTRSVPDYQGIDQSKLVPLLTAALQEAITKIESLTARIAALEE
jgi:hypothetical protein